MVQLMRPGQFPCAHVAATAARMCRFFPAGMTFVVRTRFLGRMRRRFMMRGVMTAGIRRLGMMGRFRAAFLRFRSCVRRVVLGALCLLGNSWDNGDKSKTKHDEESPRSSRTLRKKTKNIERPRAATEWHKQSKKRHMSMNLAGCWTKSKWRGKYGSATLRFVRNRAPVLPSNQLQWHCDFGVVIRARWRAAAFERAALEPCQPC